MDDADEVDWAVSYGEEEVSDDIEQLVEGENLAYQALDAMENEDKVEAPEREELDNLADERCND